HEWVTMTGAVGDEELHGRGSKYAAVAYNNWLHCEADMNHEETNCGLLYCMLHWLASSFLGVK
ncbi:hypothetical protein Dimus_011147, partial [Dionaea muscipula]